jgi:hypothetical protein
MTLEQINNRIAYFSGQYSSLRKIYCELQPGRGRDRVRGLMLSVSKKYSSALAKRRKLLTTTSTKKC